MIATLEEIKSILGITGVEQDTLIEILIPDAEGKYLDVRGIDWFRFEADLTLDSSIITNIWKDDLSKVRRNDIVQSAEDDGVKINGRVSYVNFFDSERSDNEINLDSDSTVTEDYVPLIIYPAGSKYIVAKIIDFMLQKNNTSGYKSENWGNYSYTKFDAKSGLPEDIANMIKKYQSGHI